MRALLVWLSLLAAPALAQTPPAPTAAPAAAPAIRAAAPVAPVSSPDNILYLDLSTGGRVAIQLRPDVAPAHVERVRTLARRGFYNGIVFHRVIPGFMAQGGDPTGTGTGGSDLPDLKAEFSTLPHVRGVLAMARSASPDSANSQFYITLSPALNLDLKYTVLGRVISGMNHVDAIAPGEPPAAPSRILRASVASDNLPPPVASTPVAAPAAPLRALPSSAAGPPVPPPAMTPRAPTPPAPRKKAPPRTR